ncbi:MULTISPECIES: glycosyltransferase [unclassified Vibrio]|uniref:glycosyltransferase n=1 Tax=unclassified Vibrio TaxID=2614977 RepID=UPI0029651207|nr:MULTISPECIES: glycosyltransferase [unclassified Vibrio]MDW1579758.1 glycosyltransferase [Vibrio sp. Vb2897]MDW1585913.1 glycosyltransferase [Vibrio sp. Vb2910]MDW1594790.1 glycosyltransferase [Vibrio sp. Vb2911]MDW1638019.1 glycosyltransferase [Vibrio sp. Vb2896]MDW1648322.1 glycosyltransferase [Vibrio sp. Vb2912]
MSEKVAVIMSVYGKDSPEEVKASINSILNQTYDSDLFIYCDGPLPKKLEGVVAKFSDKENIYVSKSSLNKGLSHALNSLIDIVSGSDYTYVARMDSDDISLRDRIEKQVTFMKNNPEVDVLGGACREFGAKFSIDYKRLPLKHDELKSFSVARCPFIHPTVMFRSSVFKEGYRYPIHTSFTEDMALWFILLEAGKKFANLPDILIHYKMNENTVSRRRGLSKSLSEVKLRFKHMKSMNAVNIKNITSLFYRFIFHLLPLPIMRLLYKSLR